MKSQDTIAAEAYKENNKDAKFFSIHSVLALKNRAFSIIVGNIDNTPEKFKLARELYPIEDWHIEFHYEKIDLKPVVR